MKLNVLIPRAMALVSVAFVGQVRTGPQNVPKDTHSLSVGLYAVKASRSLAVIAASFCHDLKEDTQVTLEHIRQTFGDIGDEVVRLVEACSIDPLLGDGQAGEDDLYARVVQMAEGGDYEPLWIKCADALDNLKTNHHLRPDAQRAAIERGRRWLSALQKYNKEEKMLISELEWVLNFQTAALEAVS